MTVSFEGTCQRMVNYKSYVSPSQVGVKTETHEFYGRCGKFFWVVRVDPISQIIKRACVFWGKTEYPLNVTNAVSVIHALWKSPVLVRVTLSYDKGILHKSNFTVTLKQEPPIPPPLPLSPQLPSNQHAGHSVVEENALVGKMQTALLVTE